MAACMAEQRLVYRASQRMMLSGRLIGLKRFCQFSFGKTGSFCTKGTYVLVANLAAFLVEVVKDWFGE